MSYIERKKFLKKCVDTFGKTGVTIKAIEGIADKCTTADVVEVRHGEWIYYECVSSYDGLKSGYACSVCNSFVEDEYFEAEEFHKKFCGNCGAKMDGKERAK